MIRIGDDVRSPAFRIILRVRADPSAQVAQLVEQRTENPCVGGSIPPLGTTIIPIKTASYIAGPLAKRPLPCRNVSHAIASISAVFDRFTTNPCNTPCDKDRRKPRSGSPPVH